MALYPSQLIKIIKASKASKRRPETGYVRSDSGTHGTEQASERMNSFEGGANEEVSKL